MAYNVKVLADSISHHSVRLTTLEVTLPRIILSDLNTHRAFSRNSASSRAIPIEKMIARVENDPFIPEYWGKNQKGMSAEVELSEYEQIQARDCWLHSRDLAVQQVQQLAKIGLHKQLSNRLLEPFMWQTVIISATEWENFDNLRDNAAAQPEIRKSAVMMKKARAESKPDLLNCETWHLPLVTWDEIYAEGIRHGTDITKYQGAAFAQQMEFWKKVSAGRCCRVSYLTHDGKRDLQADVDLCEQLIRSGHMSPLEHCARPLKRSDAASVFDSNFRGWRQFRKEIPNESVFQGE